MANDGKSQFKKVFSDIKAALSGLQLDTLPEIAEFIRLRIQAKARSGKTMLSGTETKLKSLSPGYIGMRKELGKKTKKAKKSGKKTPDVHVGEFFSPTRSNLTLTGQYLESIETKKIDKPKSEITIGAGASPRDGEKLTNEKLATYLAKGGRSIWGIDKTTKNRIVLMVKADIRNALKKKLLK